MKTPEIRHLVKFVFAAAIVILVLIPSPTGPTSGTSAAQNTVTLDQLRQNIFIPTCSTTSCHSSLRAAGGLVLDEFNAYANLVDVLAENPAARAAGKRRVVPGKPQESFLYQKITGQLGPGEGERMPQAGTILPPAQVEMIRQWILNGALPSSTRDIQLPVPEPGAQVVVPPFHVEREVQRNYYFTLPNTEEMRVTRFEMLYPPGSHHLNFFAYQGGLPNGPPPDGTFEEGFNPVPFANWALRAGNQRIHMIWDLPPGVAFKFDPLQKVLAQIHFVNTGPQTAPIGGMAVINLHAAYDPSTAPITMGTMFGQNNRLVLPPRSTTMWDFGVTFDFFGIEEPVKIAAATGHFHWRGKTFEIRLWDGRNKDAVGAPVGCNGCVQGQNTSSTEFDRMGIQNRIYYSDNWDDPPFVTYNDREIVVPPGWGIVYRATYVNNTNRTIFFGPQVETQEHGNVFIYFYPGPDDGRTLWFPLPSQSGKR
ncbi:MAG: hypothetical protein RMM98_08895 [Acidobacteriota bacterium]|nr:hypothetical protein [Blastocatellia bacterium]MDW8239720.1 hypothetical protein [Acidobacteriota bacterium]